MLKPMELLTRSGLFGPWDAPDLAFSQQEAGINPAGCDPWGLDSFQIFPNFVILVWGQGWYLTYHYWPTSHNTHVFEGTLYFVPAKTARERVAHELAAASFKEYGLQDANTLEATQTMLESRVLERFPLNDQEVLCRHLHEVTGAVGGRVQEGARARGGLTQMAETNPTPPLLPAAFADLEPFAAKWCLATEQERFAMRLASTMDEMQAFYDAITARADEAMTYCDTFALDDLPDGRHEPVAPALLHGHRVVPRRVLGPAPRARHRCRLPGPAGRARPLSPGVRQAVTASACGSALVTAHLSAPSAGGRSTSDTGPRCRSLSGFTTLRIVWIVPSLNSNERTLTILPSLSREIIPGPPLTITVS